MTWDFDTVLYVEEYQYDKEQNLKLYFNICHVLNMYSTGIFVPQYGISLSLSACFCHFQTTSQLQIIISWAL
jgi:hypothetical protein